MQSTAATSATKFAFTYVTTLVKEMPAKRIASLLYLLLEMPLLIKTKKKMRLTSSHLMLKEKMVRILQVFRVL
jgi:hypothetical protein